MQKHKKMKKTLLILTVSAGLMFASCGNPKTVDTESAGEAAEMTSESVNYSINVDESNVQWGAAKVLQGSHTGTINISEGSIATKDGAIESGSFTLDMTSFVETNIADSEPEMVAKLNGHLKSADFFNVDTFPTAKFG